MLFMGEIDDEMNTYQSCINLGKAYTLALLLSSKYPQFFLFLTKSKTHFIITYLLQ